MAISLVRAGKNGERQSFALNNNVALIGWDGTPDLSRFNTKDELREMYQSMKPERSKNYISNHAGQLWAFSHRFQMGDLIALPLKDQDAVAFGKVVGDYKFMPENPAGAKHVRPVEWITQDLPRNALDQDLLYSLGSSLTVCQIQRHNAEERIRAILDGKAPPPLVPRGTLEDFDEASDEAAAPNLDDYAQTQIREFIRQKFAGHDFADLIEAVLRAQGYQTDKSDPGADGGVDIIAGRGPFGFDPPRLVVQVKATATAQDIKVLRELKGVMKDFNAEQGIFVSWSGFKRTVMSEARRHFFEIRLWDASDVISAVQQYYDQFPEILKAELPLKRVWTLVQEEQG